MPPCPAFAPLFLGLDAIPEEAVDAGVLALGGSGSSSEKDSHVGSSFVTTPPVDRSACMFFIWHACCPQTKRTPDLDSLPHLSSSSSS